MRVGGDTSVYLVRIILLRIGVIIKDAVRGETSTLIYLSYILLLVRQLLIHQLDRLGATTNWYFFLLYSDNEEYIILPSRKRRIYDKLGDKQNEGYENKLINKITYDQLFLNKLRKKRKRDYPSEYEIQNKSFVDFLKGKYPLKVLRNGTTYSIFFFKIELFAATIFFCWSYDRV